MKKGDRIEIDPIIPADSLKMQKQSSNRAYQRLAWPEVRHALQY